MGIPEGSKNLAAGSSESSTALPTALLGPLATQRDQDCPHPDASRSDWTGAHHQPACLDWGCFIPPYPDWGWAAATIPHHPAHLDHGCLSMSCPAPPHPCIGIRTRLFPCPPLHASRSRLFYPIPPLPSADKVRLCNTLQPNPTHGETWHHPSGPQNEKVGHQCNRVFLAF